MLKNVLTIVTIFNVSIFSSNAEAWQLVTNADELSEGDIITFVNADHNLVASNEVNDNYILTTSAEFSESTLVDTDNILRFMLGVNGEKWTFKTINYSGEQGYIGNNTNSAVCRISETIEEGWSATISIDNSNADIVFDNPSTINGIPSYNRLRFSTSTPNRFSCYNENDNNTYIIQIYRWGHDEETVIPTPAGYVTANAVELSADIDNAGFEIAISRDEENAPEEYTYLDVNYITISEIKKLASEQGFGTFYVWARTVVDDGLNYSAAVVVYTFTIDSDYVADEMGIVYRKVFSNDAVVDNNWYIVIAEIDGRCYAMGPDGVGSAVTIRNDEIVAYASLFNGNITEFLYNDGRLIDSADNKSLSRAADNSIDVTDGLATIVMDGMTLGFDSDTNTFSTAGSNTGLMLFTTGSERNTGIISPTEEKIDSEIEYYNMQGMRVSPNVGGLYIERRGSVIAKVMVK